MINVIWVLWYEFWLHFSSMIPHFNSCYVAVFFAICLQIYNHSMFFIMDFFYLSSSVCFWWSQNLYYSWKYFSYRCHHPCSNPVWGSWYTIYLCLLERSKLNLYAFKYIFFSVLSLVTICSFLQLWTCDTDCIIVLVYNPFHFVSEIRIVYPVFYIV